MSITHEVNELKQYSKQKVKHAAKLFSHSMASAIRWCYTVGVEIYNAINTADLFDLMNDWFDVQNS